MIESINKIFIHTGTHQFLKDMNKAESDLHRNVKDQIYHLIEKGDLSFEKGQFSYTPVHGKERQYRHLYKEYVFIYDLDYYNNPKGDVRYRYESSESLMLQQESIQTGTKFFVPDISVILENGDLIWIEISHTHKCTNKKKFFCLSNNIQLFEIDATDFYEKDIVSCFKNISTIYEEEIKNLMSKEIAKLKKHLSEYGYIEATQVKLLTNNFDLFRFLLNKYHGIVHVPHSLTKKVSLSFDRKSSTSIFCHSELLRDFT